MRNGRTEVAPGPEEPGQIEAGADGAGFEVKPGQGLAASGGRRLGTEQQPAQRHSAKEDESVRAGPHQRRPGAAEAPGTGPRSCHQDVNCERQEEEHEGRFHPVDRETHRFCVGHQQAGRDRAGAPAPAERPADRPDGGDRPGEGADRKQAKDPEREFVALGPRQPADQGGQQHAQGRGERVDAFAGLEDEAKSGRQILADPESDVVVLPPLVREEGKSQGDQGGQREGRARPEAVLGLAHPCKPRRRASGAWIACAQISKPWTLGWR